MLVDRINNKARTKTTIIHHHSLFIHTISLDDVVDDTIPILPFTQPCMYMYIYESLFPCNTLFVIIKFGSISQNLYIPRTHVVMFVSGNY